MQKNRFNSLGVVMPEYSLSLLITVLAFLAISTALAMGISYRTKSAVNSVKESVPCELNSDGKREFDGSTEACF